MKNKRYDESLVCESFLRRLWTTALTMWSDSCRAYNRRQKPRLSSTKGKRKMRGRPRRIKRPKKVRTSTISDQNKWLILETRKPVSSSDTEEPDMFWIRLKFKMLVSRCFRHVEEGAIHNDSMFYTLKLNRQDAKKPNIRVTQKKFLHIVRMCKTQGMQVPEHVYALLFLHIAWYYYVLYWAQLMSESLSISVFV